MVEETTEETTVEATEAATEESQRIANKTTYTCSHCGAKVVPVNVETPTGTIHKCPECHKFMKLESPEQVKERLEESRGPLLPPDVRVLERVKVLLAAELPKVYGIPKTDKARTITAILDTLTPAQAMDEWKLHGHVKKFARNANDEHLESVIIKIFSDLEQGGYLPKDDEGYRPGYDRRRRVSREPRYGSRGSRRGGGYEEGEGFYDNYPGDLAFQRDGREQREHDMRMQTMTEEHDLKMKKLEADILKITGETGGSKTPQGAFEEVREFIDEKGNFCDPEKAVSVRIKMRPMETKGLTLEDVRRVMKEGKEELTAEKVREIIREAKPEESEEVKTLKEGLSESRKSIEDLKDSIETKEKQTLLDKIGGLESRVSDLASTGTGEWKSDEMRLIKGGIGDIKELLKTYLESERPLDRAERILTAGPGGAAPPSEMAGEGKRGGVIEGLREHGLVTKILERGR